MTQTYPISVDFMETTYFQISNQQTWITLRSWRSEWRSYGGCRSWKVGAPWISVSWEAVGSSSSLLTFTCHPCLRTFRIFRTRSTFIQLVRAWFIVVRTPRVSVSVKAIWFFGGERGRSVARSERRRRSGGCRPGGCRPGGCRPWAVRVSRSWVALRTGCYCRHFHRRSPALVFTLARADLQD